MLKSNKSYILIFTIILIVFFSNYLIVSSIISPYENILYSFNNKYSLNNKFKVEEYIQLAKIKYEIRKNNDVSFYSSKMYSYYKKEYLYKYLINSQYEYPYYIQKVYLIPNTKFGDIYKFIGNVLNKGKVILIYTSGYDDICIYANIDETNDDVVFKEDEAKNRIIEDVNLILERNVNLNFENSQLIGNKYIVKDKEKHIYVEYDIGLEAITYFQYNFEGI